MNKRRIYAALHSDIAEGFVWLKQAGLPPRGIVKITNRNNGRSVHCEALQFEKNFLAAYHECPRRARIASPECAIVMNHWYRAKLGGDTPLKTQEEYSLDVLAADSPLGKLCACRQHPQVVVRVALRLGIVSVVLGIVSLVITVSPGVAHALATLIHPTNMQARVATPTTATEVFNLRSKCADLGERSLNSYVKEHPRDQIHRTSHYDPATNRCFVELNTMLNDHAGGSVFSRILYEGQTSELVARVTAIKPSGAAVSTESGSLGRNWQAFARDLGMDTDKGRWQNGSLGMLPAAEGNIGFVEAFIDHAMADGRLQ